MDFVHKKSFKICKIGYFLFEKKTFNGLLKVIGMQKLFQNSYQTNNNITFFIFLIRK